MPVSLRSHFVGDFSRVAPRDSRLSSFAENINVRRRKIFATLEFVQNQEATEFNSELPLPSETGSTTIGLDPNKPAWGSGIAIGYWIISVFFVVIIPAIFLMPYAMMQDPPVIESEALVEFAKNDKTAIIIQILSIIPAHLFTLLLGWLIVTRMRKDSFTEALGWKSGGVRWWYYPIIIVGFLGLAAIVSSIYPEQENDLIRMIQSSQGALISVALLATFTAPIVEELVYRGVMFSAFQRSMGTSAAFGMVTLSFALVHVPQYWPSYSTIVLILLLSSILTWLRIYSKNLWPCIVLHTIFNGLQSAGLIAASYVEKNVPPTQAAAIVDLIK